MINNSLMLRTLEIIEEGQRSLQTQLPSNAVMFLGETGVGKSALMNFLAGVQLQSFRVGGHIKLKAKDPSSELPHSRIGHSEAYSSTRLPGIHRPTGQDFCYIDTPGLGDTGDDGATEAETAARDIANAYFRYLIATQAKHLKIVLIISHSDLVRGGKLPGILEELSNFIEAIKIEGNAALLKRIKESICFVVSKVDLRKVAPTGDLNAQVKVLAENLISIMNTPKIKKIKNMQEVLAHIIKEQRIGIFSEPPEESLDKSFEEAEFIKAKLHETTYMPTEDAHITTRVSSEHREKVKDAINDLNILTKQKLALAIDQDITEQLRKYFESFPFDRMNLEKLQKKCKDIMNHNSPRSLPDFFKELCEIFEFLSEKTRNDFKEFIRFFNFFGDLLPNSSEKEKAQKADFLNKTWIDALNLTTILDNQIQFITELLAPPSFQFIDNELTLSGFHIEINAVLKELSDQKKYPNLKHLVIRAYHSLTIGQNPVLDSKEVQEAFHGVNLHGVNVSLFAPQISALDNRAIDLSGVDGENFPLDQTTAAKGPHGAPPPADLGSDHSIDDSANKGNPGLAGSNGSPGKPGQSSGNLFIFCEQLDNPQRLQVKLKGGNGGNAQNGGDGGEGGAGRSVYGNRHRNIPPKSFSNGGVGGNAGKGGKGGDAGRAGKLALIVEGQQLTLDPKQVTIKNGDAGKAGAAGKPGNGGPHGTQRHRQGDGKPSSSGYGTPGNRPTDLNDKGWVEVKSIAEQNYFRNLLNYRLELAKLQNEHPTVLGGFLDKFNEQYQQVDLSILNTTLGDLLAAGNTLEEFYLEHSKQYPAVNFVPLYSAFLEQIKAFSLAPKRTPEELKVLEHLYVATLGSIARINAQAHNLLIIDIKAYVEDLKKVQFKELRDLRVEELRQIYNKQYQTGIEDKINQGLGFLEKLKQDVAHKMKEIDDAIKILELQIEAEKAKLQTENHTLQNKKRALRKAFEKKAIFGAIDLGLQAVGLLYPPAKPATDIGRAGLNMAENPKIKTANELLKKVSSYSTNLTAQKKKYEEDKAANKDKDLYEKAEGFVKSMSPMAETVKNFVEELGQDKKARKEIDGQLGENNARMKELDKHLRNLPEFRHYFEEATQKVSDFQTALKDQSLISLDFSKLELRRFFQDIKRDIEAMLGEFDARAEFDGIVSSMHDAIDVFVNICTRIQDYREHGCFANFIAHLQSQSILEVQDQYRSELTRLEVRVLQSIVQEAYFRAVSAMKQWAFPFAESFLSGIAEINFRNFNELEKNLNEMLRYLQHNKHTINDMNQQINHCHFGHLGKFGQEVTLPLIDWSYGQYPIKFDALLKGEEVLLVADIRNTRLDAVKFKKLSIKLECDELTPEELDRRLSGYRVILKHSGISYYKYLDNFYQIVSDYPIEIRFSFDEGNDSIPLDRNDVWDKIAKGDLVLSPYTNWVVKIERLPSAERTLPPSLSERFKDVKNFRLKLIGEGSYVEAAKVNMGLNLQKHYQLFRQGLIFSGMGSRPPSSQGKPSSQKPKNSGRPASPNDPIETRGGGNCAFHAVFGDPTKKPIECIDHVKKRAELAEKIRKATKEHTYFPFIVQAIQEMLMGGSARFKKLSAEYQEYLALNKKGMEEAWKLVESELQNCPYILEFIHKNTQDRSDLKDLKSQFQHCLTIQDGILYCLIYSVIPLREQFRNYNEETNQAFNLEERILKDQSILNEYADYINGKDQWLLPLELRIMALAMDINIQYCSYDPILSTRTRFEDFNRGASRSVGVCFNGRDHFERIPVPTPVLFSQPPSSGSPKGTARPEATQKPGSAKSPGC